MATIKSFSDLPQSKKLAEILQLESADMFYATNSDWEGKIIGLLDVPLYIGSDGFVDTEMGEIYAWSLAALLSVLNFPSLTQNKENEWEVCVFDHDNDDYIEKTASNSVDACYEMILKLHELKML